MKDTRASHPSPLDGELIFEECAKSLPGENNVIGEFKAVIWAIWTALEMGFMCIDAYVDLQDIELVLTGEFEAEDEPTAELARQVTRLRAFAQSKGGEVKLTRTLQRAHGGSLQQPSSPGSVAQG